MDEKEFVITETRKDWLAAIAAKKEAIREQFRIQPPQGTYYEAKVPDTLDLAERCGLAVNALTAAIEPSLDYIMYSYIFYDTHPANMTGPLGNLNCGKTLEAQPQARLASGSKEGLDNQYEYLLQILAQREDNGIFFTAPKGTQPWVSEKYQDAANVCIIGRMLRGLIYYYEYDGNQFWLEQAKKIFNTLKDELLTYCDRDHAYSQLQEECARRGITQHTYPEYAADTYAYFKKGLPGWGFLPRTGYPKGLKDTGAFMGSHVITVAYNLIGITRYAEETKDQEALELARKMANTLRSPEFYQYTGYGWQNTPGIFSPDRLHFSTGCHFQATLMYMQALLGFARLVDDMDLMEQVRSGYEWFRNFGLADIGFFPEGPASTNGESCCPAGMLILALQLSLNGVGDYWEDADRYVRNGVTEYQFIDQHQLEVCSCAGSSFKKTHISQSDDRVIERTLGCWDMHPYITQSPLPVATGGGECCTQNATQALYQTWEAIVQDKGNGTAEINLLLNRVSAQLDIDSYLPYEGKVIIKNKTAERIYIRIPNWVSKPDIKCCVNGKQALFSWISKYILFENTKPGEHISVEFPVSERVIKRTHAPTGQTYSITFRGNTVVGINPRDEEKFQGIVDGSLVLNQAGYYMVNGLNIKDGNIEVDVDTGADFTKIMQIDGGFEIGLVFRHEGNWECLHAFLGYPARGIGIRKLPEETMYEGTHSIVRIDKLGAKFTMKVRIVDREITFTVEDCEKNCYTSTYRTPDEFNVHGNVGIHMGARSDQQIRFSNFLVTDLNGNKVFVDKLDDESCLLGNWQGINSKCRYLYFKREHMKKNKAPIVKKTRFVPDHLIKR